ncbi:MAG: hypothetical protein H6661_03990 [Ardenticatenaceae bacterium]|nr:hypothetical protein [Ardenticatenaceae bacterium]
MKKWRRPAPRQSTGEDLGQIDGHVVPANINSNSQCVIGGRARALRTKPVAQFEEQGHRAMTIPVSHASTRHCTQPAPRCGRCHRLHTVRPPTRRWWLTQCGEVYPPPFLPSKTSQQQIAPPVQWVKAGLETLTIWACACSSRSVPSAFLRGFANDVFADKEDVILC